MKHQAARRKPRTDSDRDPGHDEEVQGASRMLTARRKEAETRDQAIAGGGAGGWGFVVEFHGVCGSGGVMVAGVVRGMGGMLTGGPWVWGRGRHPGRRLGSEPGVG